MFFGILTLLVTATCIAFGLALKIKAIALLTIAVAVGITIVWGLFCADKLRSAVPLIVCGCAIVGVGLIWFTATVIRWRMIYHFLNDQFFNS